MKAMSKEEKIKEAYGQYWEKVKDFVDENGYIDGVMIKNKIGIVPNNFIEKFQPLVSMFRPKSLQGIENNNGWIKIESESDLPTCDGEYFVNAKGINNNKQFFIRSWLNAKKDFNDNWVFTEYPKEWLELYSHYQPITKPKPPIY
jgi:hypothetical protein